MVLAAAQTSCNTTAVAGGIFLQLFYIFQYHEFSKAYHKKTQKSRWSVTIHPYTCHIIGYQATSNSYDVVNQE